MRLCPVCGNTDLSLFVSSRTLAEECETRERFIRKRLTRPASLVELKDLTDFFHGERADILKCLKCSLLLRRELEPPPAQAYSQDEYDSSIMEHQYPSYLEAFRAKREPFRDLLPPNARVLEVGSHYGAFLQTAQEWGWRVEGIDVGEDTTRFARAKGFTVHSCELPECNFAHATFDGIFVWNCFEQLADPKPLLTECHRLLRTNGLLVLRTPNGLFYDLCATAATGGLAGNGPLEFLEEAMGYNNLLGFPYLYGYSSETLRRLVEPRGFITEGMLNSELLTLPLPEHPPWVERQERAVGGELVLLANSILRNSAGVLAGPWIELWFRRT